jgi:hypothetical protein
LESTHLITEFGQLLEGRLGHCCVARSSHQCLREVTLGGGFFDRTLAQLNPKPLTIGVSYPDAELRTIFPQPHDIPMDWVVTGSGTLYAHVNRHA